MQITNLNFYLFFLIVFCLYWIVPRRRWQNLVLLVSGLLFYLWISPVGVLILILTTFIEFQLAKRMMSAPEDRRHFWAALCLNILVLFLFKYFNFFVPAVETVLANLGLRVDSGVIQLALPIGLSFYTLRRISYLVDIFKRTLTPSDSFTDYLLYVSFFPQLVSGPIDRASTLLPQLQQDRMWKFEHFDSAWPLIVSGLFKKIVIADNLTILVDKVFMLLEPTVSQLIIATAAFSIQILADFSAYTDLSRGLSHLLGFQTPRNFNHPFLAVSPSDFWNRWHITLSEWLRDYIFFPLRRAWLRRSRGQNTLAAIVLPPLTAMLVSGVWHGAGWNFILWGAFHGLMLAVYQLIPGKKGLKGFWHKLPGWLIFTPLIQFSWMLFRSPSIAWLGNIFVHSPLIGSADDLSVTLVLFTLVIFYGLLYLAKYFLDTNFQNRPLIQSISYSIAALLLVIFLSDAARDFIYGQF